MIQACRGDLPSKLGVSRTVFAAGPEEEAYRACLLGVVVVDPDKVTSVSHHVELIVVLVHHEIVHRAGRIEVFGLSPMW